MYGSEFAPIYSFDEYKSFKNNYGFGVAFEKNFQVETREDKVTIRFCFFCLFFIYYFLLKLEKLQKRSIAGNEFMKRNKSRRNKHDALGDSKYPARNNLPPLQTGGIYSNNLKKQLNDKTIYVHHPVFKKKNQNFNDHNHVNIQPQTDRSQTFNTNTKLQSNQLLANIINDRYSLPDLNNLSNKKPAPSVYRNNDIQFNSNYNYNISNYRNDYNSNNYFDINQTDHFLKDTFNNNNSKNFFNGIERNDNNSLLKLQYARDQNKKQKITLNRNNNSLSKVDEGETISTKTGYTGKSQPKYQDKKLLQQRNTPSSFGIQSRYEHD